MASRKRQSKTPSAGSSGRPPKLPPIFVDRSMGRHVVAERLRSSGCTVHVHDDHFAQNAPDTAWLSHVGRQGWIVLTKDKRIRTRLLERDALIRAGVAAFFVAPGDATAEQMARACVQALPAIARTVAALGNPLIAMITLRGRVQVLETKRRMRTSQLGRPSRSRKRTPQRQ
jgi:hypothetical protein